MNSLICITTCNRINELKRIIIPYLQFVEKNDEFNFLLAVDGNNVEYIEFCTKYNIPLLYSDKREGVGVSKNRVFLTFPNYDYYFFIEDDVELINESVFQLHIDAFQETGIHHFSLFPSSGYPQKFVHSKTKYRNYDIISGMIGSAQFNFFTKKSLEISGGWHIHFAKYRRYGHHEHSYRIMNNGLIPAPINFISDVLNNSFIWHFPKAVSESINELIPEKYYLTKIEQALIDEKLTYFEPMSNAKIFIIDNDLKYSKLVIDNVGRYSLINKSARRKAISSYNFHIGINTKKGLTKILIIIKAIVQYWKNPEIRHYIKARLNLLDENKHL